MRKVKGFTLIELLVVISIIAVLMSIMMPALKKVREQAKTVVCQTRVRQWAMFFKLYTSDNGGKFPDGYKGSGGAYTEEEGGGMWINALRPYYKEAGDITCCPTAEKIDHANATFKAWRPNAFYSAEPETDFGSYGFNNFLYKPQQYSWGKPQKYFWASENIKRAQDVPLFMDSATMGVTPLDIDNAPQFQGDILDPSNWQADNMKRVCLNRHNGYINMVMVDCSVRKVGLKELWKLKWHRQYDTNARTPDWPEWMSKFKDYD